MDNSARAALYKCEKCNSNSDFLWRDAHDFHGSDGLLCTNCCLKSGRNPMIMTIGERRKSAIGYREPMDRAIFVDFVMHDQAYDDAVDKRFTEHLINELSKPEHSSVKLTFIG